MTYDEPVISDSNSDFFDCVFHHQICMMNCHPVLFRMLRNQGKKASEFESRKCTDKIIFNVSASSVQESGDVERCVL